MEDQQLWEYCNKTTYAEKKNEIVDSKNNGPAQRRILLLQYCKPPEHKKALFLVIKVLSFLVREKVSQTFVKSR